MTSHVLRAFEQLRARSHRVEIDAPMEELAALAGCSVRTVERSVRVLEADGAIERTYTPGPRDRVERKHSRWIVPFKPADRGPEPWPVHGRMHGPWPPGERPVWARYRPRRKPRGEFVPRAIRAEKQALPVSVSTDKMSTPPYPSGTGGGASPAPPPEPGENASAVRAVIASALMAEAGDGSPATPSFRAPSARTGSQRDPAPPLHPFTLQPATERGARPPNPCKASREASADASAPSEFEASMRVRRAQQTGPSAMELAIERLRARSAERDAERRDAKRAEFFERIGSLGFVVKRE